MASPSSPQKLHYDNAALEREYAQTYGTAMRWAAAGAAVALLYFFALAVYLGMQGHTHPEGFVSTFSDRITIDYAGTKASFFENPALAAALPARFHDSNPVPARVAEVTEALAPAEGEATVSEALTTERAAPEQAGALPMPPLGIE